MNSSGLFFRLCCAYLRQTKAVCRGAVEAVHAIERYLEMNV